MEGIRDRAAAAATAATAAPAWSVVVGQRSSSEDEPTPFSLLPVDKSLPAIDLVLGDQPLGRSAESKILDTRISRSAALIHVCDDGTVTMTPRGDRTKPPRVQHNGEWVTNGERCVLHDQSRLSLHTNDKAYTYVLTRFPAPARARRRGGQMAMERAPLPPFSRPPSSSSSSSLPSATSSGSASGSSLSSGSVSSSSSSSSSSSEHPQAVPMPARPRRSATESAVMDAATAAHMAVTTSASTARVEEETASPLAFLESLGPAEDETEENLVAGVLSVIQQDEQRRAQHAQALAALRRAAARVHEYRNNSGALPDHAFGSPPLNADRDGAGGTRQSHVRRPAGTAAHGESGHAAVLVDLTLSDNDDDDNDASSDGIGSGHDADAGAAGEVRAVSSAAVEQGRRKRQRTESVAAPTPAAAADTQEAAAPAPAMGPSAATMMEETINCAICFEVIVHCAGLPCGHGFCRNCIANWLRRSSHCPECRGAARLEDLRPSLHVDQIIQQMMQAKLLDAAVVESYNERA